MGFAIFNSGGGADVKTLREIIDRSAKELIIPAGVDTIGRYAFADCRELESVRFLGDIISIAPNAFDGCNSCRRYDFTACTMVPQLLSYSAFQDIINEASIYVPAYLYEDWVAEPAWNKYEAYIVAVEVTEPEEPCTEGLAYTYDEYGKCYEVGRGDWEGAEELRIPSTYDDGVNGELPVKGLEYGAFQNMTMIKRVYADSLTYSRGSSFYGCSLDYLSIKGYEMTASFEFSSSGVKEVIFGDITYIDWGTFGGCSPTCRFDFSECTQIPSLGTDALGELTAGAQIVVPAALYGAWKVAAGWESYADFIVSAGA